MGKKSTKQFHALLIVGHGTHSNSGKHENHLKQQHGMIRDTQGTVPSLIHRIMDIPTRETLKPKPQVSRNPKLVMYAFQISMTTSMLAREHQSIGPELLNHAFAARKSIKDQGLYN